MNERKDRPKRRNEKVKSGLPRERVPVEKKRTASCNELEHKTNRGQERKARKRRQDRQDVPSPAVSTKPATIFDEGKGSGGILKLETKAQVKELATFVKKKRSVAAKHAPNVDEANDEQGKPVLGEKANAEDLRKVVFRQSNKFHPGEIVIVPRTRGGFSYAKITRQCVRNECYLDPTKKVRYREWRTMYPNFKSKPLFKDLPSIFIGKLEDNEQPKVKQSQVAVPQEGAEEKGGEDEDEDEDEDVEGETIMFCGMGRVVMSAEENVIKQAKHDKMDASSAKESETLFAGDGLQDLELEPKHDGDEPTKLKEEFEQNPTERCVGYRVWDSDMDNVVFAPHSNYVVDEIVVVPRSAGGFTYGKVLSSWTCSCPLGEGHKHPGWRVIIDENTTPRIVKNLLSVNVGKLHLAEIRPIGQPVDNPSSTTTTASDLSHRVSTSPQQETLASSPQQSDVMEEEDQMLIPDGHYEFEDITSEQELAHKLMKEEQQRSKTLDGPGATRPPSGVPTSAPLPIRTPPVDPFAGMFTSSAGTGAPNKNISRGGLISVDMMALTSSEASDKTTNPKGDKGGNAKGKRRGGRKKFGNQRNRSRDKPVIVLDGPNIAMKHGKQKSLSMRGIKIAADYYIKKGHDVISFLPQHYATRKAPTGAFKLQEFLPMADDLPLLEELVDAGIVILTPAQDYDDSYCIEYAKTHAGCIVSNDRYRDHVDKQPEHLRGRVSKWIREHVISYTFARDEFMPNPDFAFPKDQRADDPPDYSNEEEATGPGREAKAAQT